MNIPSFLLEMSKQINTQDNRITAEPIWQVCYDKEHVTADGYENYVTYGDINDGEYSLIFSSESGSYADNDHATDWLMEHKPDFCMELSARRDEPVKDMDFEDIFHEIDDCNIQQNFMTRRREVVKSCLTESDAEWFIQRKQHLPFILALNHTVDDTIIHTSPCGVKNIGCCVGILQQ